MWTNRLRHSLSVSILLRMFLAAIISILVLLSLTMYQNILTNAQADFDKSQKEKKTATHAHTLSTIVTDTHPTYQEFCTYLLESNYDKKCNVFVFPCTPAISNLENQSLIFKLAVSTFQEQVPDHKNYVWTVKSVPFADCDGVLVVYDKLLIVNNVGYFIFASCVGIFLFLALSMWLIVGIVKKIKIIDNGVRVIAETDVRHKIHIPGTSELAMLAQDINQMGEMIYKQNQAERMEELSKRALITNLSHDIRTPLTSIKGYIDLMASQVVGNKTLEEYLQTAQENTHRLEKLTGDLFLYSKLISNDIPVSLEKIDINLMVAQTLELRTGNIVFAKEDSKPYGMIDGDKFYRVMNNLLDNAEKYQVEDTTIHVEVSQENGFVAVTVSNTSKQDLSGKIHQLTERMVTGSEDRTDGSSGLGLAIVAELVRYMKGKIQIHYKNTIFAAKIFVPKADEEVAPERLSS